MVRCSSTTKALLLAKESKIIKSSSIFWKEYFNCYDNITFENIIKKNLSDNYNEILYKIEKKLEEFNEDNEYIISPYDDSFPKINDYVPNCEKPFLLFCKGNISLLKLIEQNVAVIGLINPELSIFEREEKIIKALVEKNQIIVSGLAKGCDTLAHKICIENKGKTIAILPSPINKIIPAENRNLAKKILESDGLLISEYIGEPLSRNESIKRYVERDRLQALFAKAIILIASYRKGEGDSGSRHAMEYAKKYKISRYVMFDENKDKNNNQFGLNYDLIKSNKDIKILKRNEIQKIVDLSKKIYPIQESLF